ncbi:MAG: hypothetical protein H5T72_06545 [Actinobacteria bacterium]|nr:hypothetical protein [Actinomycetota bacterium]
MTGLRAALKAVFWAAVAALAASAGLTVAGSAFNLEPLLTAGIAGWFAGCSLLFAWSLLLAFWWLRSRGLRKGMGWRRENRDAV